MLGWPSTGMKSVLEKARSILGYARLSASSGAVGREENVGQELLESSGAVSRGFSTVAQHSPLEGDDVLFRKNNVHLKFPAKDVDTLLREFGAVEPPEPSGLCSVPPQHSVNSSPHVMRKSLDNHVLVPGFLFVTTRGSNFGTTLILNWAPNSSLKVPTVHNEAQHQAAAMDSDANSPQTCIGQMSSAISIDLCSLEVIRIFYHMNEEGFIVSGELVLKNKEEEFKVFYFSNGGLNDLIHIFRSWTYFSHTCHKDAHCHTFTIFCPKLDLSELHPLEGKVSGLTPELWASLRDHEGRISDLKYMQKIIFFQGIASSLRKEIWPILLDVFSFSDSTDEKARQQQMYRDKYWEVDAERKKRHSTLSEDEALKWDTLYNQINKDVIRTDRLVAYYKDENNKNLSILMNIILNYLKYQPDVSYVQGMSDLLAPLLYIVDDEVEAFWCFTKLMERSALCKPGTSIKHQLELLRLLTEMLIPSFYHYLDNVDNGLSFMFCHRWLLVFFKREFNIKDTLFIWEVCWSSYDTKRFHLFICIAVMAMYGQKAVEKQMNIDELMVYFNTLSLQIPRDVVLSQARGYLYKFCQSTSVNCALHEIMNEEFWHKRTSPKLFCSICKGFGSCSRTGYLSSEELKC